MEEILPNLVFARFLIENIHRYFSENEISEIWVPFPDPYPKPSKANKRLISPRFLNEYKAIIEIGGLLHFKTDNADLFAYGYEELIRDENFELDCSTDNLYESDLVDDYTSIQTTYETIFRREGMSIKYLRAHLVSKPLRGMLDR